MRRLRQDLVAVILLTLAGAVWVSPPARADERGWYLGLAAGRGELDLAARDFDDGSITSGRVDTLDTGWKVFGGFRFGVVLAVEAGYVDLDNDYDGEDTFEGISDGTGSVYTSLSGGEVGVNVQPKGIYAEGSLSFPVGRRLALVGGLGLMRWEVETTIRDLSGSRTETDEGTDSIYSAGIEYRFDVGLTLRAEWERYKDVGESDIDFISGGFSWTFR